MRSVYFDNAATTPIDKEVIQVITQSMEKIYGNPSSSHQIGRKAKAVVENSRKNIAKMFGCSASEIVFTAGGSEADNLILRNAVVNLGVRRIITTAIEHHAVLHTIEALKKEFSISIEYVNVNKYGDIDLEHLASLLQSDEIKTLVSLMFVNNEIGNVLELGEVGVLCKENGAYFHSDTVQGIAHAPLDLSKTAIDFITASAHKFHGPKGVGFAFIRRGIGIQPILLGGEQEKGARAGTENTHNIVGMEKALFLGLENFEKDKAYVNSLKSYFIEQLKSNFPDIQFNGRSSELEKCAFHILNVRFSQDIPMLLFSLDLKGIAASGGSACQSGSNQGSHVLSTILSPDDALNTSIRFSFSKYNTTDEVDYTIGVLREIIKKTSS